MSGAVKKYHEIYNNLFRSKYTGLALLILIENEGKLERPKLRKLVECRDFNRYVMIPLLDNEYIEVVQDKSKYPYKTYVALTDKGRKIAEKVKSCIDEF
ncbi:MAG: hypothetical protein ACE5K4_04640 [Candidatus Hydrothermarchaeota archaeon]